MSTHIPSPEDLLFDRSISVLLLGFERFDRLAKVMSAFTRDIVILQKEKKRQEQIIGINYYYHGRIG